MPLLSSFDEFINLTIHLCDIIFPSASMITREAVFKKNLALKCAGSTDRLHALERTQQAASTLYPHDLDRYNDDVSQRHQRNIKELNQLKQWVREGKVEQSMLEFNTDNSFAPSEVLHQHLKIFLPLVAGAVGKELLESFSKLTSVGALLNDRVRSDFKDAKKDTPSIDVNGKIIMPKDTYFYGPTSSPYITHAAIVVEKGGKAHLAVVAVRNREGAFSDGVKVKDFGTSISLDYLVIGYNLSNITPLALVPIDSQVKRKVGSAASLQLFHDFHLSLCDLRKALHLTIRYTAMRRQFKTIASSSSQRPILSYQSVLYRLCNAFSLYLSLCNLNSRALEKDYYHLALTDLLQSSHSVIFDQLIQLRQCCGGFGYMQVSGHPVGMERTAFRCGRESNRELKLDPMFLGLTQYPTNSDQVLRIYTTKVSEKNPGYMGYFGVFVSIVIQMRAGREQLSNHDFRREYLKQTGLLAMHMRESFSKEDATNPHSLLTQFGIVQYVLRSVRWINWSMITIPRDDFYQGLEEFRNDLLGKIAESLPYLADVIEHPFVRNAVIGRKDQDSFYHEVITTSRDNLRNAKEYVEYVQEPIKQLIQENRAKM